MSVVTVDRDGHVLMIGINRPDAYNLWNLEIIAEGSRAYAVSADAAEGVAAMLERRDPVFQGK